MARWVESTAMLDIVNELRDRSFSTKSRDPLCERAANEITMLREMLTRQSESSLEAVRLMMDNASRYGYILGGLEMVAAGHATSSRVLEAFRSRFHN